MTDRYDFTIGKIEFITTRKPDARWHVENCVHPGLCVLAYAFSGVAHYRTDREFIVQSGDVLFFRSGEPHTARSDKNDPWSFCSVCFEILCLSEEARSAVESLPTLLHVSRGFPAAEQFAELSRVWNPSEDGNLIRSRALICSLIATLIRHTLRESFLLDPRMEETAAFLRNHYAEKHSVGALAERVGLSPSHFRTLFKKQTGRSLVQYQNAVRLQKACDLLKSGGSSISEISEQIGYSSVFYFSRLFKKELGVTPSEYAKNSLILSVTE